MAGDAGRELGAGEVRGLLDEVGRRLAARGVRGELFLYGGGAMAIAYDTRRVTRDVDAIYAPSEVIDEIADEIADERGLERGWLNGGNNAWAHRARSADTPHVMHEGEGLVVAVASVGQLIAMKLAAYRRKDMDDLAILFRDAGITTAEEAADVAEAIYGTDSVELTDRADLLLACEGVLRRPVPTTVPPLPLGAHSTSRVAPAPGAVCGTLVGATGAACRLSPGHGGRHRSRLPGRGR